MLAINTAFMTANLALEGANGVVFRDIDAKSKHSENVLKTIDEMCQELSIDIKDVDSVAVVVGPGSFTGLRISASIAQALGCVNKGLKFVALSSLELMSYIIVKNKLASQNFVCAINALSNLYFVCRFDKNGIKLCDEKMIEKQEFDSIDLPKFALLGDLKGDDLAFVEISCEDLYAFAKHKVGQNCFVKQEDLMPVYLRLSQAEDNLLKKSKKD